MGKGEIAQAINDTLESPEREGNVADGLFAIADSIDELAKAVLRLGNADAGTPMGGLEVLGLTMKEGMAQIASAIADRQS